MIGSGIVRGYEGEDAFSFFVLLRRLKREWKIFRVPLAGTAPVTRFAVIRNVYTIRQIDLYRFLEMDGIHLYALNKWKNVSRIIDESGLRTLV